MIILLETSELISIIVCCSVGGLVVIGALVFIINKFFLSKRRCKKILDKLDRDYEYLHSLLSGQDSQYIQRLEIISRTNLLYGDIHANYFRRFKEIRDSLDINAYEIINELRTLYDERKYKDFLSYYKNNFDNLANYEDYVNALDTDLKSVLQPEEEARQEIFEIKERFRELKSSFNSHENELSFVYDSYIKVFEAIEKKFNDYDEKVENADYEEAKAMIVPINRVIDILIEQINTFPNYINEVTSIIPTKISEVVNEYNSLVREDYPLQSYNIQSQIDRISNGIEEIKKKLRELKTSNVKEDIETYHELLDQIKDIFAKERAAKQEFNENYDAISDEFVHLEQKYIKVRNDMPKFEKYYVIDESHKKDFETLEITVNDIAQEKRRLEAYVHSSFRNPYTTLVSKMNDLKAGNENISAKLNNFVQYLANLKADSESTFKLIKTQYFKAKEYLAIVRGFDNEPILNAYLDRFNKVFVFIDDINDIVKKIPIDVNKMNDLVSNLVNLSSSLYKSIDDLKYQKERTELNILIANRERYKFADIRTLLDQVEDLYFNGEYKRALEMSSEVLDKLNLKGGVHN